MAPSRTNKSLLKKNDALINLIPPITCGVQTATGFAESKRLLLNFGHENRGKQNFEVPPVTETRMVDLIKKTLTSKTIGGAGLSANTATCAAAVLASPFCYPMNLSISNGSFFFDMENCSRLPFFTNGSRERPWKLPNNFLMACSIKSSRNTCRNIFLSSIVMN